MSIQMERFYNTNVKLSDEIIYTVVNMPIEFSDWLNERMREQDGMTQAELHRASGISEGMISKLLDGTRKPSAKTIYKLARALNLNPDDIQRVLGLLPPKRSEYSPEIINLVEMYEVLPKEKRDHVRELVRSFYNRYKC